MPVNPPLINLPLEVQRPKAARNFSDLKGCKFGRLEVLYYVGRRNWICRCQCGNFKMVSSGCLKKASGTRSCGCFMVEQTKKANTTHGKKGSRVYRIWNGLIDRCLNKNGKGYLNYGGRGITVSRRWRKFELFLEDMGYPPDGHQLERLDNNKGYDRSNCCWATPTQQARNRRNNKLVAYGEVTLTCAGWDERHKLTKGTVSRRLKRGWSVFEAISTPMNTQFSRYKNK